MHRADDEGAARGPCVGGRHPLLLRSRGSRGVSLTTEGERFLNIAERWSMLEIEAEQLKASNERHLAIGAVDAVAIHILPPFLTALSDQQPPIRLHLGSSRYFQLFNRVADLGGPHRPGVDADS